MTIRPPSGYQLPDLVRAANRVLTEEADQLRSAMASFGSAPQPGSPWIKDDEAFGDRAKLLIPGRADILRYTRHQASLIYVNAWDHLVSLARLLGGDGAMPLFAQASVSRVIYEAAVRFAWLMDPSVSSAERLVRGAVALRYSADQRSKGVRALPADYVDPRVLPGNGWQLPPRTEIVDRLIGDAAMSFGYLEEARERSRLGLQSSDISVSLKINITELMAKWLPDSPSWYNVGSSDTHSAYWGLRDVEPLPSWSVIGPYSEHAGRRRGSRVRYLGFGAYPRPMWPNERARRHIARSTISAAVGTQPPTSKPAAVSKGPSPFLNAKASYHLAIA
jgi:hypothetical protein